MGRNTTPGKAALSRSNQVYDTRPSGSKRLPFSLATPMRVPRRLYPSAASSLASASDPASALSTSLPIRQPPVGLEPAAPLLHVPGPADVSDHRLSRVAGEEHLRC